MARNDGDVCASLISCRKYTCSFVSKKISLKTGESLNKKYNRFDAENGK